MASGDARKLYREALDRLVDLVMQRSKLAGRLSTMALRVVVMTPAVGRVIMFDTSRARQLLDGIDVLMPRISAEMEEVNSYAEQIGEPIIRWQSLDTGF